MIIMCPECRRVQVRSPDGSGTEWVRPLEARRGREVVREGPPGQDGILWRHCPEHDSEIRAYAEAYFGAR